MKRSGSWARKVPLKANTPLVGSSPSERSTRLTRQKATKTKRAKVSPEERAARKVTRARSEGICEGCGGRPANSMHHRRKAGRVWAASNLMHLCGDGTTGCHGWAEANPAKAVEQGWWVPSHKDPAKTPLWLAGRGWAFLHDNGHVTEASDIEEVA